ncbi:MAG: hypothetical protein Q7T18_03055 [Sedimentisphaerales bacterium]|nr:hypothetical protein [Sedimentisphaerales bacterium]
MQNPEDIAVVRQFTDALDLLGIAYAVGGSMASSLYGEVRFTQDADITVEPFGAKSDQLFAAIKDSFYISRSAMKQALEECGSFNVIHLKSAFKIDVFIRKDRPFDCQMFARRRQIKLSDAHSPFAVVSPEDSILLKLEWFFDGGQTSERQWNDVLGIIRVQGKNLDAEYLEKWAGVLGLSELLHKAQRS